jgi:hypothetical protein
MVTAPEPETAVDKVTDTSSSAAEEDAAADNAEADGRAADEAVATTPWRSWPGTLSSAALLSAAASSDVSSDAYSSRKARASSPEPLPPTSAETAAAAGHGAAAAGRAVPLTGWASRPSLRPSGQEKDEQQWAARRRPAFRVVPSLPAPSLYPTLRRFGGGAVTGWLVRGTMRPVLGDSSFVQ